ncbi:hypothetical protein GPOL_c01780 [Gordonia polyisoprenivorans VH2]|uniref:Uncharacterized protein n=1 Tax=Gordonia polyisoprenivorans (strain DSM 44266 / VH2) TaxID=1112204 RepID=H6MRA6_GORPV|nr:hypothetical protein GPOL_c01780 [Gordonia polyisoprenivorans VH2]
MRVSRSLESLIELLSRQPSSKSGEGTKHIDPPRRSARDSDLGHHESGAHQV